MVAFFDTGIASDQDETGTVGLSFTSATIFTISLLTLMIEAFGSVIALS